MAQQLQIVVPGHDARGKGLPNAYALSPDFASDLYAAYVFRAGMLEGQGFDFSGNKREASIVSSSAYANRQITTLFANLPAASALAEGAIAEVTADSSSAPAPFVTKTGHWQVQLVSGVKTWVQISTASQLAGQASSLLLGTGIGRKVVYPFTVSQLAAATGAFTLISVARVAATASAYLVGASRGSTIDGVHQILESTHNGRAALINAPDGANPGSAFATLAGAADANRTARFEMIASAFTPTEVQAYRRFSGGSLLSSAPTATSKVLGGSVNFQSGINELNQGFAESWELSAQIFVKKRMSAAELEAYYAALSFYVAFGGIAL